MELLTQYSSELFKLITVGGIIGGALVFALVKSIDSGVFDDKKMQEYYENKKGDVEK